MQKPSDLPLPPEPDPCDCYFLAWWTLRIVEHSSVSEAPQAWLLMQLSITTQENINPF
ncbi:hypothetical protein L1889_06990 [Paenalcaligenes niemegkensis]|uniref:hypothetical protein n=1 Tax=Paenalcaligenes niemegkensis TaxID=2895469 RepID=UPI001EE8F752|nr:hypothetical protein [Paenalcaligenes niemegkensis]MCQ9616484.1 hypothetical protein [Paenalcaligenes niemegkensis]